MNKIGIETSALLAELSISSWTARRLDRTTSDEVITAKRAGDKGAARVNKNLLAGRNELEKVISAGGAARTYFLANTLPWSDAGLRLLPSTKFFEVNARLVQFQDEYMAEVQRFVQVYPTLITAQAMALGDMFKREEYPDASDIARRFDFNFNFMPVPSAGDFRVTIGQEAQELLAEQLEKASQKRVQDAMRDAHERLRAGLERLVDRLGVDVVKGEEKPRIFRDSLVSGTLELVDVLKGFNVLQDPTLQRATLALERAVQGKTAEQLREDSYTREQLQIKARQILDDLSF